jgi:hypothetical protein
MPFLTLATDAALPAGVRPLAIVRSSSDLDGKILAISEGMEGEPSKRRRAPLLLDDYEDELKDVVKASEIGRAFALLVNAVRAGHDVSDVPPPLRAVFMSMLSSAEGPKVGNALALPPNAHFESVPNPDPKQRDAIFIASPAGGGKTVWCAAWVQKYRKLFPERPVYILSKNTVADDPAWLSLKPKDRPEQMDVNSLLSDSIDIARDFPPDGCCLVFDDLIDAFDGKMAKAVTRTVQDSLQIGRRHNISVLITSHELTSYNRTRAILHDVHSCVLFANHTPGHSLRYFLSKLFGKVDDGMVPMLRKAGRAVQISVRAPQWWMGDHEARLLD